MLTDKYNHKESEKKWQNYWREMKIFQWKNDLPREQTFVIDTPPPTVSGLLHMGHVFSYTQADFVARFQRMNGKDVFYPMGFDDNGLPTERLVEKVKNVRANQIKREEFVAKCREVVDEAELEFEALFNAIALSVDWEQKYQTISPKSQALSQASFVDLWKKKLVERKFEPVFWDISDRTALAQADLVDKEVEGMMNYILFGVEGGDKPIEIMTTRPELLPACVAVMVNPQDSRYKDLHGKFAITPLLGIKVPIITDEDVLMDKGTGAVMCCTFGDETDIKWWKKHSLPLRIVIGKDGRFDLRNIGDISALLKENSNEFLNVTRTYFFDENGNGKTLKQAKDVVIEALKNTLTPALSLKGRGSESERVASPSPSQGEGWGEGVFQRQTLLTKQEPITRAVKCAERSGMPIEILVMPQWFINIIDKKAELKAKAQECNWFPEYMQVRIEQWIDGLSWDWCISRQRFFGVPFPVWHSKRAGEEGKILVADFDQLPCDPLTSAPKGYSLDEVTPETDILDTWATSSISPQLSSGAINEEMLHELLTAGAINQAAFDKKLQRHQKLFPADLRPQAHEIIRTWAFYTIAKALLHENKIPWKNLMISGWCLAADKSKMSKSKGNVVTPAALITEKGSDVVRYWTSTSHLGADTAYSEDVFKIGQKLVTKLFNAAKFASMNFADLESLNANTKAYDDAQLNHPQITQAADLWILSRLHQAIKYATESFEKFEYARAREAIESFFWHDLCDNYLEICKVRSYGLKAEKLAGSSLTPEQQSDVINGQISAILTLKIVLNGILKLFSPFIPHITEEIYAAIFAQEFAKTKSINSRGNWPKAENHFFDANFITLGEAALKVIFEVRKFKSDGNLSMKTTISCLKITNKVDLSPILADLGNVCNATEIEFAISENDAVKIVL